MTSVIGTSGFRLDPTFWVGADKVRNYNLGDPLLDWMDLYGTSKGYSRDSQDPQYLAETDYQIFIQRKGREFEAKVTELIHDLLRIRNEDIQQVAESSEDRQSADYRDRTIDLMRKGVGAVYQPVLWDEENGTFGSPDLLIRSDLLSSMACQPIDYGFDALAPAIEGSAWHYVVVDVKYKTLDLNSFGELGSDHAANKAQIALYNAALGRAQGYTPPAGFVIGRAWKSKDERGSSCLDVIGKFGILQRQFKKPALDILAQALEATEWIRRVRRDVAEWDPITNYVEIPELRPNMGNSKDAPWHKAKKQIAEETGELTQLWHVGPDKRNAAVAAGITDWRDPRASAAV